MSVLSVTRTSMRFSGGPPAERRDALAAERSGAGASPARLSAAARASWAREGRGWIIGALAHLPRGEAGVRAQHATALLEPALG